jgi:bacteriorhodopsin
VSGSGGYDVHAFTAFTNWFDIEDSVVKPFFVVAFVESCSRFGVSKLDYKVRERNAASVGGNDGKSVVWFGRHVIPFKG